jgi:hypothetical protein
MKLAIILVLAQFFTPAEVGHEYDLLKAFPRSMNSYLRKAGEGFDISRSAKVQTRLFREDLVWQTRGWDEYQLDVMVFVALSLAKTRTAKEIKAIESKSMSPEELLKVERIKKFEGDAKEILEELRPQVEEIKYWKLRIWI